MKIVEPIRVIEQPQDPCQPNPCGPNSVCRVQNGLAVCSCLQNFIGTPPSCRPECVTSSECDLTKACVQQRCVAVCPGPCASNAVCRAVNHAPICSCGVDLIGDGFSRCQPKPPVRLEEPQDPCNPSPCGPNSECRNINGAAACSCARDYFGSPPNCRPECTIPQECPGDQTCTRNKCVPVCLGACGFNAECRGINHSPNCYCHQGYTGNALHGCYEIVPEIKQEPQNPCIPSPCGINARCENRNEAAACVCNPETFGDPYVECRPECVISADCPYNKACSQQQKCYDPCPGACGYNAQCDVVNHSPICSCLPGYTGEPLSGCRNIPPPPPPTKIEVKRDPCNPSPCGPYSQCRTVGDSAICSCLPNYVGSPPSCRPECVTSSECELTKACINQKCAGE